MVQVMRSIAKLIHRVQVLVAGPRDGKKDPKASRHVESGLGFLDNNEVNFLMAASMSFGGMYLASILWDIPFAIF